MHREETRAKRCGKLARVDGLRLLPMAGLSVQDVSPRGMVRSGKHEAVQLHAILLVCDATKPPRTAELHSFDQHWLRLLREMTSRRRDVMH